MKEIRYSEERLMKILLAPVISEKATMVSEKNNQAVFRVLKDSTKLEVKAAVELIFKVRVQSVNMASRPGKKKRSGKIMGRRIHTRRAFVCLEPGQEINFTEEAK